MNLYNAKRWQTNIPPSHSVLSQDSYNSVFLLPPGTRRGWKNISKFQAINQQTKANILPIVILHNRSKAASANSKKITILSLINARFESAQQSAVDLLISYRLQSTPHASAALLIASINVNKLQLITEYVKT